MIVGLGMGLGVGQMEVNMAENSRYLAGRRILAVVVEGKLENQLVAVNKLSKAAGLRE